MSQPLPHNGWPTAHHATAPPFLRPIVMGATYLVRCACGYASDSAAESAEGAIKDVSTRHDASHPDYTATAYADALAG